MVIEASDGQVLTCAYALIAKSEVDIVKTLHNNKLQGARIEDAPKLYLFLNIRNKAIRYGDNWKKFYQDTSASAEMFPRSNSTFAFRISTN